MCDRTGHFYAEVIDCFCHNTEDFALLILPLYFFLVLTVSVQQWKILLNFVCLCSIQVVFISVLLQNLLLNIAGKILSFLGY